MSLEIVDFIDFLKTDSALGKFITCHKYFLPSPPEYSEIEINRKLRSILEKKGIKRLYTHQAKAIELIRKGRNVVVMTPTASGKSLIYHIPVIESILSDPMSKALYIFPLKGLEQDQLNTINDYFTSLGTPYIDDSLLSHPRMPVRRAEVYDGDTPPSKRKRIREHTPSIILTNPDMIHLALNPFHKKWKDFFKNLKYIVIDEIHSYRGVFGSHVSHIMRRLKRICEYYGSKPQVIACSATIGNPLELAERLWGEEFSLVEKSGAPRSGRHFIFLNPSDSPYTEATKLFLRLIKSGLRTIVFTKARRITELIYRWAIEKESSFRRLISPYRAGLLPQERREVEKRLFSGELLGVITTSALELGVDIGGLDACILVGYPGSVASTYQRAGRVGRAGRDSIILFIGLKDGLDQYFMRHPETFFEKGAEEVIIDPSNEEILVKHILSAASEIPLKIENGIERRGHEYDIRFVSEGFSFEDFRKYIDELIKKGTLYSKKGMIYTRYRMPQRNTEIRTAGTPFKIKDMDGRLIGEIDELKIHRDAFRDAIYMHLGRQYRVIDIDFFKREIYKGGGCPLLYKGTYP